MTSTATGPADRATTAGAEGATLRLAEWIAGAGREPLSDELAHVAKRLLLDYLAAAVVGAADPVAGAVRDHVLDAAPGTQATIIGGGTASAGGAALANGTAAHALELDGGYTPGGCHPSSATLPAVLALAEREHADAGRTLLAAAVAVEVACRVAAAAHPATWRLGFHNTSLAGVFGAAAGCAVLLRLDARRTADALGIAGSHAAGLFEFLAHGSAVKRMHPGRAARDGLASADLAALGITGPPTILEGEHGYFAAFARGDWDPGVLLDGLGERWALRRTYVKPYPCCRHVQAAAELVLRLRAEHDLDPRDVTGVRVETYTVAARHDGRDPSTLLGAQMSLPFAVAAALCDGALGLDQFTERRRAGEDIARLLALVEVVASEECDLGYPAERPTAVTVFLGSGEPLTARVRQPYGEADNPLDDRALEEKFRSLCVPVLGEDRAARVIRQVWDGDDPRALLRGLGEREGR